METQSANAHVSLLSRMNAFYGIPNLSPETTAAVNQGAPAPEVYSPEVAQPAPTPQETNQETNSPIESFFTKATEQVEISSQAIDLQQQSQVVNELTAAGNSPESTTPATAEAQPESPLTSPLNSPDSGSVPATGNNAPAATSALNAETPAPAALDNVATATAQPETGYGNQPGPANQPAAGPGANSNAGQPGALFSALG